MITYLSRKQHCYIAGLREAAFKTMRERNQVPAGDDPSAERRRGFADSSTFCLMAAVRLHDNHGIIRAAAAQIAFRITHVARLAKWQSVVAGQRIVAGVATTADGRFAFAAAPGELPALPEMTGCVMLDVTALGDEFRRRGDAAGVDLSGFFRAHHPKYPADVVGPVVRPIPEEVNR